MLLIVCLGVKLFDFSTVIISSAEPCSESSVCWVIFNFFSYNIARIFSITSVLRIILSTWTFLSLTIIISSLNWLNLTTTTPILKLLFTIFLIMLLKAFLLLLNYICFKLFRLLLLKFLKFSRLLYYKGGKTVHLESINFFIIFLNTKLLYSFIINFFDNKNILKSCLNKSFEKYLNEN